MAKYYDSNKNVIIVEIKLYVVHVFVFLQLFTFIVNRMSLPLNIIQWAVLRNYKIKNWPTSLTQLIRYHLQIK